MISNRKKAQKTQKREDMLPFVSSSRLRAFAPSCENPKASQGQPALRFSTNFLSSWAKGIKGGFVPRVLSATKPWSDFLAQLFGLSLFAVNPFFAVYF